MNQPVIPSMSALMACAARAAHPIVDDTPHALNDPVGRALCRTTSPSPWDYQLAQPNVPLLAAARLCAASRSTFAEDQLRRSGIAQYVVLGAGLDTSAHRLPDDAGIRTWLLDLEGVLAWRASLYARAGLDDIGTPVPCNMSSDSIVDALEQHGLDLHHPVFISWLGVSMYLDPDTVHDLFRALARLAPGSRLVFDYVVPGNLRDDAGAAYAQAVSATTGSAGEPWRCTPAPAALTDWLAKAGWSTTEDLAEADAVEPGFWPRTDALRPMRLIRFRCATRGEA